MLRFFSIHLYFLLALLVYLIGAVAYGIIEYTHELEAELGRIDEKLVSAANFGNSTLHHLADEVLLDSKTLSKGEDYQLALKLQEIADRFDVVYVYGLIKQDNNILFFGSNPAIGEDSLAQFKPVFLSNYYDASPGVFEAFETGRVKFDQYEDRWGHFRSVFLPYQIADEQLYVIGADVNIDEVFALARKSFAWAVVYGVFLLLIVSPFIFAYIRVIRRYYREKIMTAYRHPITGLPNKRWLEVELDKHNDNKLVLFEVENFDKIGNLIGVAATDSLTLKISSRLQDFDARELRHCEFYHLEDNQFALYNHENLSARQVKDVATLTNRSISSLQLQHEGKPLPLVVRMCGVFDYPNSYILARMTLDYARESNQATVIYDPALELPAHFRRYIEVLSLLSDAVQNDSIDIYFQPIFSGNKSRIIKYEALARIVDSNGNITALPNDFMPIAYQSSLCGKVTRAVVSKIVDALKTTDHIVSINLSVKDLFDRDTRRYIIEKISSANIGEQIEFELLEQQVIGNYRLAAGYIEELNHCCLGVGMDDFGKLYSNFDRLLMLPLKFVKIDGIIVEAIEDDEDARKLVKSIVTFARRKNIKVVAECCSSKPICEALVSIGIDMLQGFYLGEPRPDFYSLTNEETGRT